MMALMEAILKLNASELSEKQVQYVNITKLLSENSTNVAEDITSESLQKLCSIILNDLKNETNKCPQLIKLLQCLLQGKHLDKVFSEENKIEVMKSIISFIDINSNENTLVNCLSVIEISPSFCLENAVLNDLLKRMENILAKKSEAISAYFIVCNYFQKFLKDYEERLSNFIPVLSKLVFLPLSHPSSKIREVAEKTLDSFPKLLLYAEDEEAVNSLIKLVKESYSKDLLHLFKDKQELYVLKVWKHVINALASVLPTNLSMITPFFQVIEKGFKSTSDDVCIAAFNAWKCLISSFALTKGALNDSKKLRFILKPFKNIARLNENILFIACDSWWHLAWNLSEHLSGRFTEVCIPLLELAVGKFSNGHSEKAVPKGGHLSLIKKCCFMLLRFLEYPPSESFNRLSSPKKLPHIPYPALQIPIDIKVIAHHFKEILHAFKVIIDVCGTKEDMKHYLDCLMKSVLFVVSCLIEDTNKESVEAVTFYLYFLSDVIEAKCYPSLLCLKGIESLSKLPRKILVSHSFNCGSRKSQDILCTTLLKLLLNPHLFPSEAPKRFYASYNRLVQAGISESFDSLLVTQKFMQIIRNTIGSNTVEIDVVIEIWSAIANPLLEVIEKTQEVNQGDKHEHDFSCMYDVLIFPFEFIFSVYAHQFRTRPVFKLWTSLYKAFVRSSSLVVTTTTNESCETFCSKLKAYLKEDQVKIPHFFESVCLSLQVIIESVDFSSGAASGIPGIVDGALMTKRKKPLGNFTSFVELLTVMLKVYDAHYMESEEDSNLDICEVLDVSKVTGKSQNSDSGVPAIQRKLHIVKNAAPLDLLKTFFGSVKSGSIIATSLEQLSDPLSKLYLKSSQKKNLMNHIDSKLENLWNALTSSIERHYLGPYDSEFLAILNPILEATFSHPKRTFKEKSRRFWCATFGLNMSSLKFPDSLKNVLKKTKLPLLPDDISPTEFSVSPLQNSVSEDSVDVHPIPTLFKIPAAKPLPVKTTPCVNGDISKSVLKENKPSSKVSIDDLPSEEFVKIESFPVPSSSRRRSIRKRKSFVPTLYSDLSQEISNTQDSQETSESSATLEQADLKQPQIDSKEQVEDMVVSHDRIPSDTESMKNLEENGILLNTDNKVITDSSNTSSKNEKVLSNKSILEPPVTANFEKKLENDLKKDQISADEKVILIDLSGSDQEDNQPAKKHKTDAAEEVKSSQFSEKISVFSKPGGNLHISRNTRKKCKLSRSFTIPSLEGKIIVQKLNKSCIEISLSDSEDIIPSSQSSPENESAKISLNNYKSSSNIEEPHDESDNKNEVELLSSSCLSPIKNVLNEELISKNDNRKSLLTSTPSKSKTPVLIDIEENEFEEKLTDTKHEDIALDAKALLIYEVPSIKTSSKFSENVESLDDGNASIMKPLDDVNVENGSKDEIKVLNLVLDTVENMVENKILTNTDADCNDKTCPKSTTNETYMPCVESEIKTAITSPAQNEKVCSQLKEVKKYHLRKSEIDSSQTEAYSLKLRSKMPKIIKPLSQLRQRKSILKEVGNCNKHVRNSKGSNSKNISISLKDKTVKLKDSSNVPCISESETEGKSSDLNVMEYSEESKEVNNSGGCTPEDTSLIKLQIIEVAHTLNEPDKETVVVGEVDMDALEDAESCEIFGTYSENSCKNIHGEDNKPCVIDNNIPSSDAMDVDNDEEAYTENNSQSKNDTQPDKDSQVLLPLSLEKNHDTVNNIDLEKCDIIASNENINNVNIMIIPSSLENDNLDISSKSSLNDSHKLPLNSLPTTLLSTAVKDNNVSKSDEADSTFHVQFDDTEDDCDHIREIVHSVIEACDGTDVCNQNYNVSNENKLIVSEDSSNAVSSDKKEISVCSEEKPFSENYQNKHSENEDVFHQLSQNSSLSDDSDSVQEFSSDSHDAINLNDAENEFLEDSNEINCNAVDNLKNSQTSENDLDESTASNNVGANIKTSRVGDQNISSSQTNKIINTDNSEIKSSHRCKRETFDILCNEIFPKSSEESNSDMQASQVLSDDLSISKENDEIEVPQLSIDACTTDTIFDALKTRKSLENFEEIQEEVQCLIDDLVLFITKLDETGVNKSPIGKKDISCGDLSIHVNNLKIGDSPRKVITSNSDISVSLGPSNTADKENQLSDDSFAKGSKRRKIKAPIRSPINFRQRGKIDISKKSLTKHKKLVSVTEIKNVSQNISIVSDSIASQSDPHMCGNTDNSMTQIISSLVDSIAAEEIIADSDVLHVQSCSSDIPGRMPKSHKIELSTDELTDLNTRFNASIAPQTRRSKMIAASHTGPADDERDSLQSDVVIVCSEDATNNLSSILKKRKSSSPLPPAKIRKVTFASPLIQELVIESYSETKGVETLTMSSLQNISKKRKKVLQEKNKPDKINSVQTPAPSASDDIPSSSEYQDSDDIDCCDLSVSPALIGCQDSISNILKDLTSPPWIRGLESLLVSKNIKTIGDVCKLNIHQLKALPFRSPKVLTLHKALSTYLNRTQESVLEKFKTIDDGSFSMDNSFSSSDSPEISDIIKEKSDAADDSILLVETVNELLKNKRLKELPLNLLGELIKACGNTITEKCEESCIVID